MYREVFKKSSSILKYDSFFNSIWYLLSYIFKLYPVSCTKCLFKNVSCILYSYFKIISTMYLLSCDQYHLFSTKIYFSILSNIYDRVSRDFSKMSCFRYYSYCIYNFISCILITFRFHQSTCLKCFLYLESIVIMILISFY